MKPDRIVAGLGNPGRQYQGTRHNAGYMVLAELARRNGGGRPKQQFRSETLELRHAGRNALLLSPLTFMNLSGEAVGEAIRFYKMSPEDLLVICDEADLAVGEIRVRRDGGSGGQKGLANIIARLGTDRFSRLRIGIGRPTGGMELADYVLAGFRADEAPPFAEAISQGANAVLCWLEQGPEETMNRFNGKRGRENSPMPKNRST